MDKEKKKIIAINIVLIIIAFVLIYVFDKMIKNYKLSNFKYNNVESNISLTGSGIVVLKDLAAVNALKAAILRRNGAVNVENMDHHLSKQLLRNEYLQNIAYYASLSLNHGYISQSPDCIGADYKIDGWGQDNDDGRTDLVVRLNKLKMDIVQTQDQFESNLNQMIIALVII